MKFSFWNFKVEWLLVAALTIDMESWMDGKKSWAVKEAFLLELFFFSLVAAEADRTIMKNARVLKNNRKLTAIYNLGINLGPIQLIPDIGEQMKSEFWI